MAIKNYKASDEEIYVERIEALKKNIGEIIETLETLLVKERIVKGVCTRKKNDLESCLFLLSLIKPSKKNRKDTEVKLKDINGSVHRVRTFCSRK